MKKVIVIGIGSRIMRDDAVGICLVEDLMSCKMNSAVTYVIGETDVDYCIEEVLNYDHIIVIDAYMSGKQPGEITTVPLEELDNEKEGCLYSSHGEHILDQLKRKRQHQSINLIGIEPYEINYGFSLSDPLQQCYSRILYEVGGYVGKYARQYGGRKDA